MFKKILVAIDGSEHSMKATDAALELAQMDQAHVELLYVAPSFKYLSAETATIIEQLEKDMMEESKGIVAKAAEKFEGKNVQFETNVILGNAADLIIEEAEKKGIDVIVMGSRGLNAVSRFFLGSVSHKVLTYAPCSVLIVR
ncbi:universal stress protein [Dehalobacterium formicoaceticum]|uniref:Universal stress protein n=1 Tax=Dehalobacterium formicoaceticum TaxID=51515 RepID=A0ABT1Y7H7_9FIRM|nr:universal stress protein [Dehalobacterium formicoaceticum]MCR6546839.1 universal stress protein [Dehalobacterium formicoaceticum]